MTDLDARCFIKRGNALVPADFAADEFLSEIPNGREVLVSIRRPRSPQHHRWFFAMLRKVVENSEHWSTEEDLLDDLKIMTGHITRRVNLITGEIVAVARSINFASMPQDPFNRFVKRACFVLAKVLGVDPEDLMRETNETQRLHLKVKAPSISPARERRLRDEAKAAEKEGAV